MTVPRILAFSMLAVVVGSCSATGKPDSPAPSITTTTALVSTTTTSVTTTVPSISAEVLLTEVGEFLKEWNDNQLRWVTAWTDPDVGYGAFVAIQQQVGVSQTSLLTRLYAWADTLDPEIRRALDPLLENYRNRRLVLINELFPAALGSDEAAFQAALQRYQEYSLPQNVEAALRTFFTLPVVEQAFEAEGVDPDAMIDSLMQATGS